VVMEGTHLLTERERLVVALDFPGEAEALHLVDLLEGEVSRFQVGPQLFSVCGPTILARLRERGAAVFLDLKLHDIPSTVASTLEAAVQHGVFLATVHASGGRAMLAAAMEGARRGADRWGIPIPRLVGVTLLTHLTEADLPDIGFEAAVSGGDGGGRAPGSDAGIARIVNRLARLCVAAGLDGVMASAREVRSLREEFGPEMLIVTPGIRPRGEAADDQARVDTPTRALRGGASFLVVGRPIIRAADPREAARRIIREMEDAFLIA